MSYEEVAAHIHAVAAVARTAAFTANLYDRERYERIVELCAELSEMMTDEAPSAELAADLRKGWLAAVLPGAAGYVTPKISTAALCFDGEGRMLLGKRGDSGLWFFPTGWLEVGLLPSQNIVKEVLEETGIHCHPLRLLAARHFCLASGPSAGVHNVSLIFLCEALSSDFQLHPLETLEAGFFTRDQALEMVPERILPTVLHGFEAWHGNPGEAFFDPPL